MDNELREKINGLLIAHGKQEMSIKDMEKEPDSVVAIARALITKPQIILADEPTGALDSKTSVEVMQLMKTLNAEEHITQIIVTHDPTVASQTNRIIRIKDGIIE